MTDTKQILAFIAKLNEDAELIFQKKDETQQRISDEKSNVEKEAKKLKKKMEKSLSEYENSHFESVKAEIQSLIDTVKDDYYEQYESANVDEKEFGNLSLSKLQAKLDQIFADINRFAEDLNSSDFDKLVPPISIRSESESFYVVSGNGTVETFDCDSKQPSLRNSSPVSNIALGFFTACKRGICCIDSIVKAFRRGVAIEKFNSYVDTSANAWISEKSTSIQNAYKTELDKLFISENTQNSYRRFFQNIKKEGEQYDVDIHNGTSEYKTAINIGNIRLPVTSDDEKLKLFDTVLPLKENIKNGMISVPFIMNLKEHGSILLEIDANDEYPEEVKSFVNQLIIQFLLSFPPNRIKFCLVDIHDKMDLSQFSLMEKINAGILFDGIVHDNRIMEDAVRNMEQMMYDVKDKKLSYNNVNDVFEYNARFEANPQSVSLFVLTDFPYGLREDLAQRILNIVKNSSKTGIFTIVVHNKAIGGNYDCSDEKIQKFVAAMKEKAVFVRHANNAFVLSDDRIFTGKTEINRGLLPEIVETLRINAERSKQKVVSLSQMFDETDRLASLPDGILSSAAVLDIPIGVKGGEIQNLLLKTTGDGSAHAVVIGGTGSGKSNLLHTIIMNVCYKYSPDEVNLYLVDFKGGVEFKYLASDGEMGYPGNVKVIAVAGHDTASAVASVPAKDEHFAYLSSGTWSLMGIESPAPMVNETMAALNFTNEGGVGGTTRLLKNITGMWLLEQCLAAWRKEGREYSYPEAAEMARSCRPSPAVIDPDAPEFAAPGDMPQAILRHCAEHGIPAPETDAAMIRLIYDSLAARYAEVLGKLREVAPFEISTLHIIGGGSQNDLLNQMTADACGIRVVAGPAEATALGNVMIQAGLGRSAIAAMTGTKQYNPR